MLYEFLPISNPFSIVKLKHLQHFLTTSWIGAKNPSMYNILSFKTNKFKFNVANKNKKKCFTWTLNR